jgi:hypothetical protein
MVMAFLVLYGVSWSAAAIEGLGLWREPGQDVVGVVTGS